MTRIDSLLKTLQVRPVPPEALVQAYLIHIADKSDTNFRKILDLKGVRKSEQAHLMELYQIHRDGTQGLIESAPLLASLQLGGGAGSGIGGIGGPVIGGLGAGGPARFDAGTFGNAIMNAANAARDGVERMGTNTGGLNAGAGTMGAGGTLGVGEGEGKATINENLRNIGKFFRRDMGGFGGRFGGNAGRSSVDD
jgi:hypothetical protein